MNHRQESVIVFKRKGNDVADELMVLLNMTPVERIKWEVKVQDKQTWKEVFNSDALTFWGTGNYSNNLPMQSQLDKDRKAHFINVNLPPLGGIVLKRKN